MKELIEVCEKSVRFIKEQGVYKGVVGSDGENFILFVEVETAIKCKCPFVIWVWDSNTMVYCC